MLKDTQRKAAMYGMHPPAQPYPNVVATLPARPAQRPAPPSSPQYASGPSHPAPPGQFAPQQYYGRPNDPSRPPQVARPGHDDGQGEENLRIVIFCLVCTHRVFLSHSSQGTVCLFVDTTTAPTPRPAGSRPRLAATLLRALHRRTTSSTRSTLKPAARPNPFLPRKGTIPHTPRVRCPHHRLHTSSILPPACMRPHRARGT